MHQLTKLRTSSTRRSEESEPGLSATANGATSSSSFIMDNPFTASIDYLSQRKNLLHISEARTYEELNDEKTEEGGEDSDNSYNPVMERDAAKLSNVDDKLYLDIFIPCAN